MQKEEYQDLDEFLDDGKIVPANQLPAGWQWEMYNDGSGSLHGPNSERYYSYDLAPYATSGLIEYNATGKGYDTFEGSLDDFRNWAEQQVQAQDEVQKYRTQLNQTYDSMANDPQKYLDYLTFRGQCVGLGAENSVAVFAQNPKATYCPAPEALGRPMSNLAKKMILFLYCVPNGISASMLWSSTICRKRIPGQRPAAMDRRPAWRSDAPCGRCRTPR